MSESPSTRATWPCSVTDVALTDAALGNVALSDRTVAGIAAGPAKSAAGRRLARWLLRAPIYVWLLVLVVAPDIVLVATSFWRTEDGAMVASWSLRNYHKLLGSETYWLLIARTLLTAAGAALIAGIVAYPMAYFASRKLRRGKSAAILMVVIPLWISLLIRIFAWRILLGQNGILNSMLVTTGVLEHPSANLLYTRFTVFLTLTYVAIPFVFVTSFSALERIPHSLVEASQDLGADALRSFRHVVWPLSRQGAALGVGLAFLLAVGDYITPSLVGGLDGTMLGMIIASQYGLAGNWPLGAAMAVVLVAIVAVLLAIMSFLARSPGTLDVNQGGALPPPRRRRTLGAKLGRYLAWVAFALPYCLLYLPLAVILLFSFNDSRVQTLPLRGLTAHWYLQIAQDGPLLAALGRSLTISTCAVAISIVFGVLFALIFTHVRIRGAAVIQGLIALPVIMPGVVLGVSLLSAFKMIGIPPGMLRTTLGHVTFIMPVIMLMVLARLQRLDPTLEQASMDLGANRVQTFFRVTLPLIRSTIVGGALLGFTLSLDEVIVTLFLSGFEPTLPIYIWNQMRFGFTPVINAVFSCIGLLSLVAVVFATRLLDGGSDRRRSGATAA